MCLPLGLLSLKWLLHGWQLCTRHASTFPSTIHPHPHSRLQLRDLKRVGTKLKYVILPRHDQDATLKELRQWDLCVS